MRVALIVKGPFSREEAERIGESLKGGWREALAEEDPDARALVEEHVEVEIVVGE